MHLPPFDKDLSEPSPGVPGAGERAATTFLTPDKHPTSLCFSTVLALGVAFLLTFAASRAFGEDFEFFEKNVRPVLAERCYKCHSVASGKSKGGLLLDTKDGLLKGGDNGPAIVPRDPGKSRLIEAVRYGNPDLQMPPPKDKGQRLDERQVADLVAWVKSGAPDPRVAAVVASNGGYDFAAARRQWAFHPPVEPAVPEVRQKDWVKGEIDRFILAKLEEKGLKPAPAADRRTLIRRATYDLIGLPPTAEEVEAFVNDPDPAAFAKVVDRLLASPRYGQRWGRHWLDVVRYTDVADSRELAGGGTLPVNWRYRDWVVDAFNRDLPYDQFIVNQIAGDLLVPPGGRPGQINADGIIATGAYAIGEWGTGDSDKEKMLTDIVDDQIDVTGRAFLGLTLACARCHDHKFDPIPSADYYSLAGIFFSSHILPDPGKKTEGSPILKIPLAEPTQLPERQRIEAKIAETQRKIEAANDDAVAALSAAVLPELDKYLVAANQFAHRPTDHRGQTAAQFAGGQKLNAYALSRWVAMLDSNGDGSASADKLLAEPLRDVGGVHGLNGWRNPGPSGTPIALANPTDQPIAVSTFTLPPHSVTVHPSPTSAAAVGWKSPVSGSVRVEGRIIDGDPNCGDGVDWRLCLRGADGSRQIVAGAIPNGGAQALTDAAGAAQLADVQVKAGDTLEAAIGPKGEYSCDTTVVELRIVERDGAQRSWDLARDVSGDILGVGKSNLHADSFGNLGVWRFYETPIELPPSLPPRSSLWAWAAMARGAAGDNEEKLAKAAVELRDSLVRLQPTTQASRPDSPADTADKAAYQLIADPHGAFWADARKDESSYPAESRQKLTEFRAQLATLQKQSADVVPYAYGLQEGGTPNSSYVGIHDGSIMARGRYDRLGEIVPRQFPRLLAGDHQTPLGSVTNGSGRLELAKWIASADNPLTARVMVNRIWQHHFGEGIVRTPNNYGKLGSPPTHPELLDYLALRFVQDGWSIKAMHRQIMLSSTYQQSSIPDPETFKADPENLLVGRVSRHRLEAEALRDSMLADTDALDDSLHGPPVADLASARRTLYLMTIRSDRASYRMLFDAPDPVSVAEKRIDSTVAPQALFLLNSSFAVDRAKALAALVRSKSGDDRSGIEWLYNRLFSRPPTEQEIAMGLSALKRWSDGAATTTPAAWEQYCQVLMCSNEFIYID